MVPVLITTATWNLSILPIHTGRLVTIGYKLRLIAITEQLIVLACFQVPTVMVIYVKLDCGKLLKRTPVVRRCINNLSSHLMNQITSVYHLLILIH